MNLSLQFDICKIKRETRASNMLKYLIYSAFIILSCNIGNAEDFRLNSTIPSPKNPMINMSFKDANSMIRNMKGYITSAKKGDNNVTADKIYMNLPKLADGIGALLFHSTSLENAEVDNLAQLDPQELEVNKNAFGFKEAETKDDEKTQNDIAWLAGFYGAYLQAKHVKENRYTYSTITIDDLVQGLALGNLNYGLNASDEDGYREHIAHLLRLVELGAGPAVYNDWSDTEFSDESLDIEFLEELKIHAKAGSNFYKILMNKALEENLKEMESKNERLVGPLKKSYKKIDDDFKKISTTLKKKITIKSLPKDASDDQRLKKQEELRNLASKLDIDLAKIITDKSLWEGQGVIDKFIDSVRYPQKGSETKDGGELAKQMLRLGTSINVTPDEIIDQADKIREIYKLIMHRELENYAAKLIFETMGAGKRNIRDVSLFFPDFIEIHGSLMNFLKNNRVLLNLDQTKVLNIINQSIEKKQKKLHISGVWSEYTPGAEHKNENDDESILKLKKARDRNIYGLLPQQIFKSVDLERLALYDFYAPNIKDISKLKKLKHLTLHRVLLNPKFIDDIVKLGNLETIKFIDCLEGRSNSLKYKTIFKKISEESEIKNISFFSKDAIKVQKDLADILKTAREDIRLQTSDSNSFYNTSK